MRLLQRILTIPVKLMYVGTIGISIVTALVAAGIIYCFPITATVVAIIANGAILCPLMAVNIYYVWRVDQKYNYSDIIIAIITGLIYWGVLYLLIDLNIMPYDRFSYLYIVFPSGVCCVHAIRALGQSVLELVFKRFTYRTLLRNYTFSYKSILKIYTVITILLCIIALIMCILDCKDDLLFS